MAKELAIICATVIFGLYLFNHKEETGITEVGTTKGPFHEVRILKVEFGAEEPCLLLQWLEQEMPRFTLHCRR